MLVNIEIGIEGIAIDIADNKLIIPLDQLDTYTMRSFGKFVLTAWRDHQQYEINRKFDITQEFLDFERA